MRDEDFWNLEERVRKLESLVRGLTRELQARAGSAAFEPSDMAVGVTEHGDTVYAIARPRSSEP
jgi:dihydroxyacetone kinase